MITKVFIHLDITTLNRPKPSYRAFSFDASNTNSDYILVAIKDVEFTANNDYREQAVAKIDEQIKNIKAAKQYEISTLETRKAELLAISNEVIA
jgi:hypothetical protein